MEILQQADAYLFPVLMALAIIYFSVGWVYMKHSVEKEEHGEHMMMAAMASMFWIISIWLVVHIGIIAMK